MQAAVQESRSRLWRFSDGVFWLVAAWIVLAAWGGVGIWLTRVVAALFLHVSGPNQVPLWLAYTGLFFSTLLWPATLLIITRWVPSLNRMIRWVLLIFAGLLFVIMLVALGANAIHAPLRAIGFQAVVFARELHTPLDGLATSILVGLSVFLTGWPNKRIQPVA